MNSLFKTNGPQNKYGLVICLATLVIMLTGCSSVKSNTSSSVKEDIGVFITEETFAEGTMWTELPRTTSENTRPTGGQRPDMYREPVELGNSGGSFVSLTDRNYDLKQGEGLMLQMQYFCIGVKTKAFVPGKDGISFEAATADYAVSDIEIADDDGLVKINGVITNNTAEDVTTDDTICVYAVFYDSEGDVLGIGYTVVDDVDAGGETCFEIGSYYEVEEYVG